MSTYRKLQSIMAEIVDTEKMIKLVKGHTIMRKSFESKLKSLEAELKLMKQDVFDPKIDILFSGDAVVGSEGIKANFLGKVLKPIQALIKSEIAQKRGKLGKRGQAKNAKNNELFLTSLPVGSFGVELKHMGTNDLLESTDAAEGMESFIELISSLSTTEEQFEKVIENIPARNITHLKTIFREVSEENSILKIESNDKIILLNTEEVNQIYDRISLSEEQEREEVWVATFKGLLLDSEKFDAVNEDGLHINGSLSEHLSDEELVYYIQNFINIKCRIHLRISSKQFKVGEEKLEYELLKIESLE